MKTIPLTRGKFAIVDDEDFDSLSKFKWQADTNGYAFRTHRWPGGQEKISMSRVVCSPSQGLQVDHINGNPCDNRRSNLRSVTLSENVRNRKVDCDSSTGFKGVDWVKRENSYRARITYEGKIYHLGTFHDPIKAAKAYNEAALRFHGEFARLNSI